MNYILKQLIGLLFLLFTVNVFGHEITSLNGEWEIIYDDENVGREQSWIKKEGFDKYPQKEKIEVPSCWETFRQDYEGVAIYKKEFFVPKDWENKNVSIQFEAVNYISEVYLNDEVVGYHKGGFTPFDFRINKTIKYGEQNTLIVRVVSPVLYSGKVIDGIGPHQTPMWRGALTGGIWQDVSLKVTDDYLVDDVFITTKYQTGTVNTALSIENTATELREVTIQVNVLDKDQKVVASKNETKTLTPGKNAIDYQFDIEEAELWSPKNPYLYTAEVKVLKQDQLSDEWAFKFGIREFVIKEKKFYLNGEEFFVKGGFFEGVYPTKLAYPDSDEMARKEIQMALDAGFNMIRPWRKPPPRKWLDLCDEMGVLTIGSLAIECMHRPIASPMLPEMVEIEVRESILRDRNRTCVIQWELFNELWQPVLIQMLHPMALLARELDPTRLILDESGGFANGANIYLPGEKVAVKFSDIHTYPGWIFDDNKFQGLTQVSWSKSEKKAAGFEKLRSPGKHTKPGSMVFVSEIGYGSIPDLELNNQMFKEKGNKLAPMYREHIRLEKDFNTVLDASGMRSVFPTLHDLVVAQQNYHGRLNKRMIEASRSNYLTAGYCIHALSDGDWIIGGGIIDLWRNPKGQVYELTKKANQPQLIVSRIRNRNIRTNDKLGVKLFGINEYEEEKVSVKMIITDNNGKEVAKKTVKGKLLHGVSDVFDGSFDTEGWSGTYTLTSVMKNVKGKVIIDNQETFDVFDAEALKTPTQKIMLLEADDTFANYFRKTGIPFELFDGKQKAKHLLIVGKLSEDDAFKEKVKQAKLLAKNGGTVVFTEVKGKRVNEKKPREIYTSLQPTDNFPYDVQLIASNGLWHNAAPIVTDHPVFKGLPTKQFMEEVYYKVGTTTAIVAPEGKNIVGVITHDRFPNQDHMLRNYIGVGKVYFNSEFLEVNEGKGKCVYTTMAFKKSINSDPATQIILNNIIRYYSNTIQ
ncbi:glycoside hydrolase family 2 [Flammeovirga sp. MY04]|nr:glycoside hydrolase family 2 [Flammeovirga sp. MY04]ANQ51452.1 glycoside hydrolase family 2 [Flammeovirga sp. MY04]